MILILILTFINVFSALESQADDSIQSYLNQSYKKVEASVESISKAQYDFRISENRWTIKENIEHLIKVERTVQNLIFGFLKSESVDVIQSDQTDEKVIKIISVRDQKLKAPTSLHSSNDYETLIDALHEFKKERNLTLNLYKNTKPVLRQISGNHPILGNIDGVQWFLFASAHTIRHLDQIEEIVNHHFFPKK